MEKMAANPAPAAKEAPYYISDGRLYDGSGNLFPGLHRTCREILSQSERFVFMTADAPVGKFVELYVVKKRRQTATILTEPVSSVGVFFQREEIACFLTTTRERAREYQEVLVVQDGFIRSRLFGPHLFSDTGKAEIFAAGEKAFVVLSDSRGQEYANGKPRLNPKLDGKETTVLVMRFHFGNLVDIDYERFSVQGAKVGVGAVTEPELAVFISPQDGPARIIR